jgi:hypothetical protein
MIGLYGDPLGARKVPIVFDAGSAVSHSALVAGVTVSGSYTITEEDMSGGDGIVTETRVYTGTVSGSTTFTMPRVTFDPRYLNSTSAFYIEPPMDSFCAIRHPRWLFPGIGSGTRGFSFNGPMSLARAVMEWNNTAPFSTTPITDEGNLAITVTRETTPERMSAPYDDHLSKAYNDTLGGQAVLSSSRGKMLWSIRPIVNSGTDYPATGTVNAEFYQYDVSDPFPRPADDQEVITDIHRTELGAIANITIHQAHPPNEETAFFRRTYTEWTSTWTYEFHAS